MSIASEIQRLKTSKASIKAQVNIDVDDINEGTDFIDEETLDDYADLIENMQDAYKQYIPIYTKMIAKGDTSQNGTPTPTSPIEVKTVTGEQVVRVCKKNLFDKNTEVTIGKYYNGTGDVVNDASNTLFIQTFYINVLPNTRYNFSANGNDYFRMCEYAIDKTFIQRQLSNTGNTNTYYFITSPNTYFIRVSCATSNIDSLQIEKGTSVTSFEPYQGKDYEINLKSKNLLTYSDLSSYTENGITVTNNNDGTFTVNGTATTDLSTVINTNFIPMSGTWRMVGCPSGGSSSTYMLSAYVGYWGGGSPNIDTGNGTSITYTGNVKVRFYIKSGTTCNNLLFKPMLTYDTEASYNNFSSYYNIELCKIGNYQDFIRKGSGKNLFDNSDIKVGYSINASGEETENSVWNAGGFFKVKPNTTYTISIKYATTGNATYTQYNSSKTFISRVGITGGTTTFTTSATTEYLRYSYRNDQGISNIQVEEKSSATYYEPYGYGGKWYIEKQTGKVVLDNTSGWSAISGITYYTYNASLGDTAMRTDATALYYSNCFKAIATNARYQDQTFFINSGNRVCVSYNDKTTVNDFNLWIKDNNLKVYYVLANPTYTLIENEELLNQLEAVQLQTGENNVLVSGDLPMILDLSKYIQIAENHL